MPEDWYLYPLLLGRRQRRLHPRRGYYFKAARDYGRWFDLLFSQPSMAFSQVSIDSNWSYNPEHPVLMKSLFALSDLFFHRSLDWLDGPTAMRLPRHGDGRSGRRAHLPFGTANVHS